MQLPESRWADLDGPVHWVDYGGPDGGPLLVGVHGLGGSHVNWLAVAPLLTPTCRLVALDLPGFGRTRGLGRSTSVRANRDLLHRFVGQVAGRPPVLVGNSMGGMIAAMEASAHPRDVAGLVLVDPALPPVPGVRPDPLSTAMFAAYFTPGLGRRLMTYRRQSRSIEQLAMDSLNLCCADSSRVPPEVVEAHVRLGSTREYYDELEAEFVLATRSTLWTVARRRRYAGVLRRIVVPVLMIHGASDRLVNVASARGAARANPAWRYEEFADTGHVPQLERPRETAATILDWLSHEGVRAADEARVARIAEPVTS